VAAWLVILGTILALSTVDLGSAGSRGARARGAENTAPREHSRAGLIPALPPRWEAFAVGARVRVYLPTPHPILVGFHEAIKADAVAMRPLGTLVLNASRRRFKAIPDADGPEYVVMKTRHRANAATSAVDIVIPAGSPVFSPVTGRVVSAHPYKLYGEFADWRIAIVPRGFPRIRVVIIHVADLAVRRGDVVFATLSSIGHPRVLPFRSQVDDYEKEAQPHVHIEVKELAPPATG
jgi:hypothetical protein